MVDTVGKRLRQARLRKQVTVDQAAHATKVRPERIVDLENDDYTNFPSMTYAKGFLLIYARFLNVDVSDYAGAWENANPVSMEDYEYLTNAPERRLPTQRKVPVAPVWPVLLILTLVVGAAGTAFFVQTLKRLNAAVETPKPAHHDDRELLKSPAPVVPETAEPAIAAPTVAPEPQTAGNPEVAQRGAEAGVAASTPDAAASPTPAALSGDLRVVTLKPLKKTWVKVQQDVEGSPPVFEDWLYPDARALSFRGSKFWIELGDAAGVQIVKDGTPLPTDRSIVTIE